MRTTPAISVVVPIYNGERFLGSTRDSLAAQRDVDLEVIVVDDGSTDASADLADGHPVGARVVRQRNLGVAVARNRGLAEARAAWAAFMDQDDLWHPDRLNLMLRPAATHGARMVATTERPFALTADHPALAAVGDGRELCPEAYVNEGANWRNWSN